MPGCCRRTRAHPQDGLWSWVVCISASLSQAVIPGFSYSFGVLLPTLMSYFQTNRQRTVWVGSSAVALMTLIGPVSGPLCDRFGCRTITICGTILCTLSLVTSSFANRLEVLYFTFGVMFGIGNSFVFTSALLVVPGYFSKWRSIALSFVAAGIAAGILILGPSLQAMLDSIGWKSTLRVMAGVVAMGVILGFAYDTQKVDENEREDQIASTTPDEVTDGNLGVLKKASDTENTATTGGHNRNCGLNTINGQDIVNCRIEVNKTGKYTAGPAARRVENNEGRARKKFIDCSVWKIPLYTVVTLSSTLAVLSEFNPQIHLMKHTQDLGIPADTASTLYIYLGISSVIARLLAGILSSTKWIKGQHLYQLALFGNGVSTILLPLIKHFKGLIGYVIVYGACNGIFISMLNILILGSVDEEMRAGALGMQLFLSSITVLVGPPIAGWIADIYGSYNPAFYMGGSISIAASLSVFILYCFKEQKPSDQHREDVLAAVGEDERAQSADKVKIVLPECVIENLQSYVKDDNSIPVDLCHEPEKPSTIDNYPIVTVVDEEL